MIQKRDHVLWGDIFWQVSPYKDTFNNVPWHRGNQQHALGLVSPLSSSVGSQRDPKIQCCPRECHLGKHCERKQGALAPRLAILIQFNC